jgi:hypothetical protein
MPPEALLRALRHLWLTLTPSKIPMALMGGIALAAWKHVRATKDIDLLLGVGGERLSALLETLQTAGVRLRGEPTPKRLGQLELLSLAYEPPEAYMEVEIDLLFGDSPYHRTALRRAVPILPPDLDISLAVLTCEDLILHKLQAGRMIDLADVAELLKLNRQSLDFDYLARWGKDLSLDSAFRQVWASAWPDLPLPNQTG